MTDAVTITPKIRKPRPSAWQVVTVVLFLFYMLLPIVSTYVFSISTRWDRTILPEGLTLRFYGEAFKASYFIVTLRNSFILSLAAVLVELIIVVPTVYWVHTRLTSAKPLLDVLMILPLAFLLLFSHLLWFRSIIFLPLPVHRFS